MNRIGMWCLGLLFPLWSYAQIQRDYRMVSTERIENKAYYFTALLQEFGEVDSLVCNDPVLKQLGTAKLQRLKEAKTSQERVEAMKFSAEEVEEAGKALARLYQTGNPLDRLLTEHLLPSGCYQQYKDHGAALLEKIWRQDAEGMNYAVEVYAAARKPHYPQIDSIGFDIHSQRFVEEILPACQQNIAFQAEKHPSFYAIPLLAVRTLLDVNDRCQSVDYEPLSETENKAACAQIRLTDWEHYPYTAILVLGAGPEEPNVSISPEGKLRAAYAALLYRRHQAPFIIVSGGRVHPYHTPYNEAFEMKKYLMDVWQVPESCILIEPHARHTTTNFRNAARLMFRYGFPVEKAAVVTSSASHLNSVEQMDARCLHELGYVPYRLGKRRTERTLEFFPLQESFRIQSTEPLDP